MKRRQVFRAQASKSQSSSSVRRFTNSGPVLPFNPASIPGCQLWLDAADTSSILLSGSSNVSIWIDKSGNGYNFTQSTSGNQPTYSVASQNNQNTITFTSANSTYLLGTASTNFIGTNSLSVYGVFKTNNNTSSSAVFSKSLYGSAEGRILYGFREPGTPGTIIGGIGGQSSNAYTAISDAYTAGAWRTFGFVSDRSGWTNTTYQNGTSIGEATIPSNTTTNLTNAFPMLVGAYNNTSGDANPPQAGYYLDGGVGELLVFSSALTTIQRQKVEGYLAHKWGLQTSLPSNHPHKTIAPTYEEPVFVPTLISGNQLWLDGSDPAGSGTAPANGATVSTWIDKATGKNAVATGTPTYFTGGGVNFNGSSYFLNQNFIMNLSQRSVFIVMQETNQIQYAGIFILIPTLPERFDQSQTTGLSYATTDNSFQVYGNNSYGLYIGNANPLPKAIYNESMNITAGSGYLNGTNTTNVTATYTAGTCSGYGLACRWQDGSVFGSLRLNGVIYEILIYNTPLSTTQRRRVEGYLAQKWGLQSSLPANHPFKTIAPTGIPRSITIQSLSALFNTANSSHLSIPANSALTLGTNNHTIEFWLYQTSRDQYNTPFMYGNQSLFATNNYFMNVGTYIGIVVGNGGGWAINIDGGAVASLNEWHHYAIVRNGTTFTFYLNGTSRGSATSSTNITAQGNVFRIGNSSNTIAGYISNFRFVNGTAVYTSNFTPPTSPLTAIPNTQILIQGLVDRSPNAFTVTNNGGVTLSTSVSPFV